MLYKCKHQLVGHTLSIDLASSILSKHIKKHLPVKVTSRRIKEAKKNEVWLGGMYHSEYDKKGHSRFIEVQLAYSETAKNIRLTDYKFKRICTLFADVLLHEIIHTRQYRARNFKTIPVYQSNAEYAKDRKEQEYYGDRDEMGAHSFNIACDMIDKFGFDPKKIHNYLNNCPTKKTRPNSWQRFLKAFEWNHNHPKVRQMKRKVINQLECAYAGKPFKTSDYLTY
jgi:hypothetical protein